MRKGRSSSNGQNGELVQSWGLVHSKNLAPCEQQRIDCFDSCGVAFDSCGVLQEHHMHLGRLQEC